MDAQIVDNQKDLLLRVLEETLHEVNEDRDVQRTLVELEPHEAAIAHGGRSCSSRTSVRSASGSESVLLARNLCRSDPGCKYPSRRSSKSPPCRALPAPRSTDNPAPATPRSFADRAVSPASVAFCEVKPHRFKIELHRRQAKRLAKLSYESAPRTACAVHNANGQLHLVWHLSADPALDAPRFQPLSE